VTFPPVGVTAVIAGMALFNRDAAIVESRLNNINRTALQMQAESTAGASGAAAAFAGMASTLTTVAVTVAAATALAGAAAVKFAADFEQGLALVKAIAGPVEATDEAMAGLQNTIINLSRHGTIALEDLEGASVELARSGVTLQQQMDGALEAVQNLTIASGGELGLEKAAKLTATAMNAFGLSVNDLELVTTAATVVAQNSALTFTDFGTAVQYAGATFKAAGFDIKDLAVGEALLGKNGITGSVAATSLRGVIQRLIRPSKDAAEVMQKYGIHLFDSAGNAVGFTGVLAQLNHAFSDQAVQEGRITEEERLHALSTLGLQRTGAAFLILSNATSDSLKELYDSFERLKVSELVATQLNTLNSQMGIAFNNVKALALVFGQQFLPMLTESTKGIVKFLQGLTLDQAVQFGKTVSDAIRGIVDAVNALVTTIGSFIKAFGLGDAAAQLLKSTLVGLAVIVGVNLVAGFVAAAAPVIAFALAVGVASEAIAAIAGWIHNLAYTFGGWISQFGPAGQQISKFAIATGDAFGAIQALFTGDLDRAFHLAAQSFYEFTTLLRGDGGSALAAISTAIQNLGASLAPWVAQWGSAGQAVSLALSGISGIVQSLQFLLQGNLPAAGAAAQQAFKDLGLSIDTFSVALYQALEPTVTWITGTALPTIQTTLQSIGTAFVDTINQMGVLNDLAGVVANIGSIFGSVFSIIGNLLGALGNLGEIALRAAQGLGQAQESSNGLYVVVGVLVAPIKSLAVVLEGFTGLVANVFKDFDSLSRALYDTAQSANQASPSISGFADAFVNLGNILTPIMDTIGRTVIDAFDRIGAALTSLSAQWSSTWPQIETTTATAIGFIQSQLGLLPGAVQQTGDDVSSTVSNAWATVQSITQAIWGAIPADIQTNLQAIVDNVGSILGNVPPLVQAIWMIMFQELMDTWNNIVAFVEGELQALNTIVQFLFQQEVDLIISILSTLQGLVAGPIGQFQAALLGGLAAIAAVVEGAAVAIAQSIISGLVSGLAVGTGAVTGAIRGLMDSAVAAARASIGAHSPATAFADIGQDAADGLVQGMDDSSVDVESAGDAAGVSLAQGLIDSLDRMKAPVRASAAGLVDEALSTFTDITNRADQLLQDTEAKMAQVGETVGRKINEAIKDAADKIAQTIADANQRIQEMQDNLAQSRSDRGERDTLKKDQDRRRQARREKEEDDDAAAGHAKDLTEAEFKRKQDIDKANAKATQDLSQATTDAQRAAIENRLADELAATQVSYQQDVDKINAQFAAEEAARLAKRQREHEDADFERQLDQETQDLNDKLENEALARSIARAEADRDARIKAINDALTAKEQKIQEEGAREIVNLQQNVQRRLQILEDEFAKKAAELLRKGGESMAPLVENIQQIISSNFGEMRNSAQDFANTVADAINALKALEAERAKASSSPPINVPSPVQGIGDVPDIPDEDTDVPLPEFTHGGFVPGRRGQPRLVIAHGGEFIASVDSAAARIAQALGASYAASTNTTYQVNAAYSQYESPTDVTMDMRALVALSRG
jgi:TP901 family phage tail tape measure protein